MENGTTQTLNDFRPDVGSDEVRAEQERNGFVNRHVAAERVALQTAPLELLPPSLRRARRAVETADAAHARALADLEAGNAAIRNFENRKAEVETARQRLAGAERALALSANDAAGFAGDIAAANLSTSQGFAAALERAHSAAVAEHLAKVLPDTIEKLRADLAAQEAELSALARKLET